MKKHSLLLTALAFCIGTVQASDYIVSSATSEDVAITTSGSHHLVGDGTQSAYKVVVAENLGDVTLLSSSVKIYPETTKGSALVIGKGTHVTLQIEGTNHYQGKTNGAGIEVLGELTIEGVTATDSLYARGSSAAGIGGCQNDSVGAIIINSGKVYCYGTSASASLGAATGSSSYMSAVTINGGEVTCFNDSKGCAIGCGTSNSNGFGTITINGGLVRATTNDPAAIGTNYNIFSHGKIYINGGTIYATAGGPAQADIGEAYASSIEEMVVTGGAIYCLTKGNVSSLAVNAAGEAVAPFYTTLRGVSAPTAIEYGTIVGTDYSVTLGTDYGINDAYSKADGSVCFFLPAAPDDAVATINTTVVPLNEDIVISQSGNFLLEGTGAATTHGISVAASLGEVNLTLQQVNIQATTALQVGAGTTVHLILDQATLMGAMVNDGVIEIDNSALRVEGSCSGSGTLRINGGTHYFKGTNTMSHIVINGGSVQTVDATGNVYSWENVENDAHTALQLFVGSFDANKKIINGSVSGTDYVFDLASSYGLTDVYASAEGQVFLYIPSVVPADAVVAFNTLITINTQTATSLLITEAGKYWLQGLGDGTSAQNRTGYPIEVAADIDGKVDITLENVYIKPTGNGSAMNVGNNTVVDLHLVGYNRLDGRSSSAGLNNLGLLTIDGDGTLYAKGDYGAGIGGNKNTDMGDIVINGGNIIARAGNEAAGIGGANGTYMGNITINGGTIDAMGATYGPAIGSGIYAKGAAHNTEEAVITINGGTILAQQGSGPCAIGKGTSSSNLLKVVIKGGSINTQNSAISPAPVNENEEALVLLEAQLENVTEPTRVYAGRVGSIALGTDYGMNDVYTDATGKLYFYLPEQEEGVSIVLDTNKPIDPSTAVENTMNDVRVFAGVGCIYIQGAQQPLSVYDITGRIVRHLTPLASSQMIEMSSGLYILTTGNQNFKVLVR